MNPETMESNEAILLNSVLGITGEAGEVSDLIKKWCYHGHDLDVEKVRKEIGDILFYVSLMAVGVGSTLDEIAQMNIDKLSKRYPNGFSVEDSKLKRDENEGLGQI